MLRQKKLGLYWGEHGLDLVEAHKNAPVLLHVISFESLEQNPIVGMRSLVEDPRLLELIQTTHRSSRFSTVDTCLSLPSKDIIIRWFVIPWVKPSEIQGVVVFEARKYIPFPLEDLFFTYYPSVFMKDGTRQIGISFVAIRKTTLTSYLNVLRQAGLNVVYTEPSPLSLVRALAFKKLIDTKVVSAIINFHRDAVEIVITSLGHVRFIRDFKLSIAEEGLSDEQRSLLRARMFNEVKISLDFYARQQADSDVKSVVTISSKVSKDFLRGLGDDLGVAIRHVEPPMIFDNSAVDNMEYIYALGSALSGGVPSVVDLDLSEDQGEASSIKEVYSTSEPVKPKVLIFSVICVLVAAGILAASFFMSRQFVAEREAQKQALLKSLGPYAEKALAAIQAEKNEQIQQLKAIKSLKFRSGVSAVLVSLTKLVPEGIWFQDLDVVWEQDSSGKGSFGNYSQAKKGPVLSIEGHAYLNNTSDEFKAINRFVDALKEDKVFAKTFTSIKLKSTRKITLGKFEVTSFILGCE